MVTPWFTQERGRVWFLSGSPEGGWGSVPSALSLSKCENFDLIRIYPEGNKTVILDQKMFFAHTQTILAPFSHAEIDRQFGGRSFRTIIDYMEYCHKNITIYTKIGTSHLQKLANFFYFNKILWQNLFTSRVVVKDWNNNQDNLGFNRKFQWSSSKVIMSC